MTPSVRKITIHAYVRIRKLVQKGITTSNKSADFQRAETRGAIV